jgi:hypothetical protein
MRWILTFVKSFAIGILSLLVAIAVVHLALSLYMHIAFPRQMAMGIGWDEVSFLKRRWGFSNTGVVFVNLVMPMFIFLGGFTLSFLRFARNRSKLI